jgi:hypothetical protein
MTHTLKTWPEYFKAVRLWEKNFEVRKADRDFKVGDRILFQEWNPETGKYTGQEFDRLIGYILKGGQFGIEEGYVVIDLKEELF